MIRKRNDIVSDEEFLKIIEQHGKEIDNYLENIIYNFVAFYLAKGYELSALWETGLINHVNSAIESFSAIQFKKNFNYNKLKAILKNKYNLIITNEFMLDMEVNINDWRTIKNQVIYNQYKTREIHL